MKTLQVSLQMVVFSARASGHNAPGFYVLRPITTGSGAVTETHCIPILSFLLTWSQHVSATVWRLCPTSSSSWISLSSLGASSWSSTWSSLLPSSFVCSEISTQRLRFSDVELHVQLA